MVKFNNLTLLEKILLILVFLYANVFASPIIHIIRFPIWESYTLVSLFLIIYYALMYSNKKVINKLYILLFLITLVIGSITAIYYKFLYGYYIHLNFLLSLVLFSFFDKKNINMFISSTSIFFFILLIGAYIGFIYGFLGGRPIFSFPNPDGRMNKIYLTTFTNAIWGGRMIRPAGIYDEPGALSFFICAICLLRILYKHDERRTFYLLLLGIITASLTHLIVLLCYTLYFLRKKENIKNKLTIIGIIIGIALILYILFYDILNMLIIRRLQLDVNNNRLFRGDNRSFYFFYCLELLDIKTFFLGLDITGFYQDNTAFILKFGSLGEHPLTPLVRYGIFSSWYYYLFLLIIFCAALVKRKYLFIYLSVCILYFQRPYSSVLGYSFYLVMFFMNAISVLREEFGVTGKLRCFIKR